MTLMQRFALYGLAIASLNGLFYNKADSQIINHRKNKLEHIISNHNSFNFGNNLEAELEEQDVLYLKNGSIIRGKIVEMLPDKTVKIRTADGSLFVYQITEVEKIVMEEVKKEETTPTKYAENTMKKEEMPSKMYNTQISFGYGNSFGGFGASLQGELSENISVHAGGGYFPLSKIYSNAKDMFMVAGGIKVYFNKKSPARFLLDSQFGMLGGEYKETTAYSGRTTTSSKEQQALYGPSALIGGEIFLGDGAFGLLFAGGVSYNLAEITWKEIKVVGALDLGLAVRF